MNAAEKPTFFYGWVIVATCFVAATSYGLFYTFGVFFKSLQTEFGWGRALTGSVHSLHLVIYALSTYFFGRLTDRHGPRRALSLGALFIGTGLSLCSQISSTWHLYFFDSSPKSAHLNNLSNDDMLPENRLNRDPPLPWREGIKGRGKLIPYSPPPQPSPINGEGDLLWLWSSSTFPMNTKELIF
jgi:hypothetical protein